MGFNDVCHDYIGDIEMTVGRRFLPTKEILVEDVLLPRKMVFAEIDYSFEAEERARDAFEKQDLTPPIVPRRTASKPSTPLPDTVETKKNLTQEVLVPQPRPLSSPTSVQNSTRNSSPSQIPTTSSNSFVDFEAHSTVFDDVELLALDEKKALQEVLMPINNNNNSKSETPPLRKDSETTSGLKQKDEDLKKRLLGKGYRSDIVQLSLEKLPRNRFVHIEYYMKACRTIEKTGRSTVEASLNFLIDSQLTDKQLILKYSETCAHLLKMGFSDDCAFRVTTAENGDTQRALDKALLL